MDSVNLATKLMSLSSDMGQNSEEHRTDISKLVHISELVMDYYNLDIVGIYVTPGYIVQTRLSELDEVGIHIILSETSPNTDEYKGEIATLCYAYMKDEYPEISKCIRVYYDMPNKPVLCLATKQELNVHEDISDPWSIDVIKAILDVPNIQVDISPTWNNEWDTIVLIHVQGVGDVPEVLAKLSEISTTLGNTIGWCDISNPSMQAVMFVIIDGIGDIPYGLPYVKVTESDLNMQILDDYLKGQEEEQHI